MSVVNDSAAGATEGLTIKEFWNAVTVASDRLNR